MAALDAARDLLPNLLAVVTLHGWYDTTDDLATTGEIRAKILILHGAEDPTVPPEKVCSEEKFICRPLSFNCRLSFSWLSCRRN